MAQVNVKRSSDLNIEQVTNLILRLGNQRTVLVQGHMGSGKSSILNILADKLPTHKPVYFDCTTKDLGDIMIPKISADGSGTEGECVKFVPNEEFGIHLNQPIILMIDEFGKANRGVQNALALAMLEHKLAGYQFHPDSIVFATTNKGGEGVGDLLQDHHRNRICVVQMEKGTSEEWVPWAMLNNVDPSVIRFAQETPQLFQSYEDVKTPEDNLYIFHPQAQRDAFVTHRSLEAASDIVKLRNVLSGAELSAALAGTIGEAATHDMMAFIELADQLPTLDSIKDSPDTAIVPTHPDGSPNNVAISMIVYKAVGSIDRDWASAWFKYMARLPKETQTLFIGGVSNKNHPQRPFMVKYGKYTEWCLENNYLYA